MSAYPPDPPGGEPATRPRERRREARAAAPQRALAGRLSDNGVRVGAIAVILAVVAVILVLVLHTGGSSNQQNSAQGGGPTLPFNITFPPSWTPVHHGQLATYPGNPVMVLLRENHTGVVVITRARSDPKLGLSTLGPTVAKRIADRFPDTRTTASKLINVRSGKAFYYSFVRTQAGTVNALLVVPAGAVTYEFNSVTPGNQSQAAKEVGQIFASFRAT